MNSKKALDNLVHCKSITKCKECRHQNLCTMERDYNIIKKDLDKLEQLKEDLEVLGILKKFIIMSDDFIKLNIYTTFDLNEDEQAKIKEWLESE